MPATTASQQVTITLPGDIVEHIRTKVASGLYTSESDYVESLILSETLFDPINADELTHWINTEGVRRLQAMEDDPSSILTHEQAFDCLDDTFADPTSPSANR